MMTQNCDESNTKENEQIMMIPLEVDYDDNKKEGFLDEYNKDDGSSFPLHITSSSSPSSSYNKNRTTRTTMTKCLHFRIRIVMATIFIIAIFSAVLLFGTRRTPILRFRIGNEKQSSSSSSSSSSFFSSYSSSDDMNMNMNRTFKIMQITDIHLGEAEYTDWGPEQDRKTMKLLNQMFEYEKPDLIVLGGDQITANNCLGNCTEYYQILGRFLSNYGIPWATIMGNHDDMAYEVEDGTGDIIPHPNTLRRDLIKIDKKFPLSLSLSSQNSSSPDNNNLTGVTNYVLDVLDPITDKIALQIFFLDSGGGSMYEAIEDDQVQWLRQQAAATTATVPAVAFQHIPTSAHEYIDADTCLGYQGEGVAELQYDGGIVDAMIESGRFHFLAVGHNHGNDYCCPYSSSSSSNQENDLYFCFGRHSGYGGYGKLDRGVRMYELLLTNDDGNDNNDDYSDNGEEKISDGTKVFQWRTWVRLESGLQVDSMDYDHIVTENDDI